MFSVSPSRCIPTARTSVTSDWDVVERMVLEELPCQKTSLVVQPALHWRVSFAWIHNMFLVLCSVNVTETLPFSYSFHASYFIFHNQVLVQVLDLNEIHDI